MGVGGDDGPVWFMAESLEAERDKEAADVVVEGLQEGPLKEPRFTRGGTGIMMEGD